MSYEEFLVRKKPARSARWAMRWRESERLQPGLFGEVPAQA